MTASRLREIARSAAEREPAVQRPALEECEMCGEPIGAEHRHLLDLDTRELKCACRACTLLFDRRAAGGGHFRLVPDRRLKVDDLDLDDVRWADLAIPVDMAFFFHKSDEAKVVAYYPSPAGPTESLLELDAWEEIERDNPLLGSLEPDVEALLVNRARGARQQYVVPIEDCYALVGLIRTNWRGFSGGSEVWERIKAFFEELDGRSKVAGASGEETKWQT
ncbi:MAG: hypothetical protein QOJ12_1063 [Thermoleophilales bacterium]|nr:hypothetical protein [Thermoleophilales bacterium]